MLRLKGCPRCKGDLHTNRDLYGSYTECLQCGYMRDLPDIHPVFASVDMDAIRKPSKATPGKAA